MAKTSTKFDFDNGRGQKLSGVIDTPADGAPKFWGVFAPCFTCVKESHGAVKICRALAERGIAMLRFDMTGLGASAGDFSDTNFTTRVADIIAACNALPDKPVILVGHSISGTAALSALHSLPFIRLLATIGSPEDPAAIIDKFRKNNLITEQGDDILVDVLGRPTTFRKSFIDDMLHQETAVDTAKINKPLLVFHAPNDTVVKFANAQTIASRNARAELIPLSEAATHLFEKDDADAEFIAEEITAAVTAVS